MYTRNNMEEESSMISKRKFEQGCPSTHVKRQLHTKSQPERTLITSSSLECHTKERGSERKKWFNARGRAVKRATHEGLRKVAACELGN